MDIIVECPCKNTFAFSEDIVGGRVKTPVSCPNCGQNCTQIANEYIDKVYRGEDPLKSASKSKFGFTAKKPKVDLEDLMTPEQRAAKLKQQAATTVTVNPNVRAGIGAGAAVVMGILGALGWYWLVEATGIHFGILAWGIGGLVGGVCRWIVPSGGMVLAGVAGASTFLAVMAGHVLVLKVEVDKAITKGVERAYNQNIGYANQGIKLNTDDEIRQFLAQNTPGTALAKRTPPKGKPAAAPTPSDAISSVEKLTRAQRRELDQMSGILFFVMDRDNSTRGSFLSQFTLAKPEDFSAADIKEFRDQELPELRELIAGKPAKAEWINGVKAEINGRIHYNSLIAESLTPYSMAWMMFGLITAAKLAYNKSETEDV